MAKIKVPDDVAAKAPAAPVVQPRHPHIAQWPIMATIEPDLAEKGLVLYTDGGCKPSRGKGGWGLHGYLYSAALPKKGAGNSDHILTADGYVTKTIANTFVVNSAPLPQITPIHYVDGWGSFGVDEVTNNIAEMTATISALRYAADYDVSVVQILTDSEYVQKNISSGQVATWARNNWIKSDQQPVANVEFWKDLVVAREALEARGVKVAFNWVRGHNDNLGNELADQYASYGVIRSQQGVRETVIETKTADGYWKYETERHPMLANRRLYFNTMAAYNDPGFYYLGDHGKEDDLLGKRISDGCFSVVQLKEPDSVLELLRNHQIQAAEERDAILMMRLDQVFKPSCHQQLMRWGSNILRHPKDNRLDLIGMDEKEPLVRELNPPRLAVRAVESLSQLADKLDAWVAGDPSVVATDLTAILYETSLKTKKVKGGGEESEVIQTLKADYNVGFAALAADVLYGTVDSSKSAKITLTLGIDLLDRNALKRLEGLKPQVKVLTWLESPTSFRYATVVVAGEDKGIWAGVYSNLRIVS